MFKKSSESKEMARIYLAEGLIKLMKKRNFEDISVTEICLRAGVSRMTYYRYFDTKKSVLDYYMMEIIEEYIRENEDANKKIDLHDINRIKQCFVFFKRYSEFALCLKNADLSSIMLDGLNKYMEEHAAETHADIIWRYHMYYFAGALYNVFIHWLESGMKESEETMAQIVVNLTMQI